MDYAKESLRLHEQWGGKIEVNARVPVSTKDDLSLAYTPGVAQPCLEIRRDPDKSYTLTRRHNLCAVITDGSAVLGLGDIGPEAGMPVMEGKCVLFKAFADVDAFPLCIRTKDVDEFVRTVYLLSGSFGGINLEDIAAPRCFEIERKLKELCDIPVFHDDQHGTAIITLAGLTNALRVVGKRLEDVKIVVSGAGAAAISISRLLLHAGARDVTLCDRKGAIYAGRTENMNWIKTEMAEVTNLSRKAGTLAEADINKRAAEVAKIAAATKLVGVGRDDLLSDDIAKAHHDIARTVAEHSSVLLKNDAATLPLKPGTRVAVIGDMAATARYQGSGSSKVNATKEENILDEVKNAEGLVLAGYEQGYDRQGKPDEVLLNDAVALAKKDAVDVVLAVVGLDERSESEGLDRSTMAIPQAQNDLVTALAKTGKPVVIVLVAGSPVELPWFNDVAAMLYVGLSGQAGASATVRALTGEVNPSGHLAETWPMQYEDCPSSGWYPAIGRDAIYREGPFVGYRYYETVGVPVRFPFGYGLSYSTFTYSAITATATGVDFVVTNDSDVAGSTVAQLYVRAPQGGVLHPDRELKGFVKVELAAHESKSVHIDFDRYTFRHFDVAANAWKTESGEWTLLVGDNAEHLPLAIPHTVAGDCTPAECAADPALGHYLTGQVKDVTDAEMAVLFGHEVLAPGKPTTFGVNDPIMSWVDSKGFAARTVARTLTKREAKIRQKTGSPDLNTLFILNMPPRAMSKMTQGMVDSAMVDAIVNIANGHTFRGLGGVIAGFFRNQSANKRTAKELNHD